MTEQLNKEVLLLNRQLLEKNTAVVTRNGEMAEEEHIKKMQLYELQNQKLLSELGKQVNPSSIEAVGEFHRLFGAPIHRQPTVPSEDRQKLRCTLLLEEVTELIEACGDKNIVEIADALADIQYVLTGAVLEFGLGAHFKDLFDEVHRSNMSKSCKSEVELQQTLKFYEDKEVEVYSKSANGAGGRQEYVVYRKSDNKVLKSINYSPANLAKILNNE